MLGTLLVWRQGSTGQRYMLDARHRLAAAKAVGLDEVPAEAITRDPVAMSFSNLHLRHLTPGPRAAVAARLLPKFETELVHGRVGVTTCDHRR